MMHFAVDVCIMNRLNAAFSQTNLSRLLIFFCDDRFWFHDVLQATLSWRHGCLESFVCLFE